MPSIVFDVPTVGVGCINQVCNMSVSCYECRDWLDSCNWRYRTLKARCDSTMRCRLGLRLRSDQFVCVTDTVLPFINKLIPSVQVQVINRVYYPRRPLTRLAYRTVFYI